MKMRENLLVAQKHQEDLRDEAGVLGWGALGL